MGKKAGWKKEVHSSTEPSEPYTNEMAKAQYNAMTKAIEEDPDGLFSDPDTVYIIEYTEDTSKLPYYNQIGVKMKAGEQDLANNNSYYARKTSNHKFKIIDKTTYSKLREFLNRFKNKK